MTSVALDAEDIARYRRDGYLIVRGVLEPGHVAACLDALAALSGDPELVGVTRHAGKAFVQLEPGTDTIRKFGDFTEREPALRRAAFGARLHGVLDRIMGEGRLIIQEMALVKPPRIGGEKRWHQDAAYFRVSDPNLVFGVWIALDPATARNGCMEVVPGSHLRGPVAHVPDANIDLCAIRAELVRPSERIACEMAPGDALIFHSLLHHYTAPNLSDDRRRALQFHYQQLGAEWISVGEHQALYHDASGAYAGCTVSKGLPITDTNSYKPARLRPVVPV
jgi:ectoine hydroxylase-related dioxygenase (phytanoyl-CoA dioxygenase family)